MNSVKLPTTPRRASVWARLLSMAALATGALTFAAAPAQARDVHFSVGVHAPGVSVGISNHRPPVYYSPPPVYYAPPPVYYAPPPVYYAPPPVHRGVRPVVVVPPPIYYDHDHGHRGHRKHWKHKHHDHKRDWDHRDNRGGRYYRHD